VSCDSYFGAITTAAATHLERRRVHPVSDTELWYPHCDLKIPLKLKSWPRSELLDWEDYLLEMKRNLRKKEPIEW
jgi:hypothetical protein